MRNYFSFYNIVHFKDGECCEGICNLSPYEHCQKECDKDCTKKGGK